MPTREILASHPLSTLRDEITKSNKKLGAIPLNFTTVGDSGKKTRRVYNKEQVIDLMMAHPKRFHHIKMRVVAPRASKAKPTGPKKPRSAAQIANTAKLVAANKARRAAKK